MKLTTTIGIQITNFYRQIYSYAKNWKRMGLIFAYFSIMIVLSLFGFFFFLEIVEIVTYKLGFAFQHLSAQSVSDAQFYEANQSVLSRFIQSPTVQIDMLILAITLILMFTLIYICAILLTTFTQNRFDQIIQKSNIATIAKKMLHLVGILLVLRILFFFITLDPTRANTSGVIFHTVSLFLLATIGMIYVLADKISLKYIFQKQWYNIIIAYALLIVTLFIQTHIPYYLLGNIIGTILDMIFLFIPLYIWILSCIAIIKNSQASHQMLIEVKTPKRIASILYFAFFCLIAVSIGMQLLDIEQIDASYKTVIFSDVAVENPFLELNITSQNDFVLIEFTDFYCPYCQQAQDLLPELINQSPEIDFVVRHFPLTSIHPGATLVAEYYECEKEFAQNTAELLQMKKKIFEQTNTGLIPDRRCNSDIVARDLAFARKVGLEGTPAFLFLPTRNATKAVIFYGVPTIGLLKIAKTEFA